MKNNSRKEILDLYRSKLPHGSISEIAKIANVQQSTVSQFFRGNSKSIKIEYAVLRYIKQLKEEKETLLMEAGLL